MSEMVERVAKAIASYWLENGFDPSEPDEGAARAAIEAMREPIKEMLYAATMQVPTWDNEASRRKWQAMIDAAMKEK